MQHAELILNRLAFLFISIYFQHKSPNNEACAAKEIEKFLTRGRHHVKDTSAAKIFFLCARRFKKTTAEYAEF